MNTQPSNWVPFVAAAATLTAALVALFKEDVVKLWRHPKLTLRMRLEPPDCVKIKVTRWELSKASPANASSAIAGTSLAAQGPFQNGIPAASGSFVNFPDTGESQESASFGYFFRLLVENSGELAQRVQVRVSSVSKKAENGTTQLVTEFIPMNLRWADSLPDQPSIFETINPHMGKYCDFAMVSESSNSVQLASEPSGPYSTFDIQTEVMP